MEENRVTEIIKEKTVAPATVFFIETHLLNCYTKTVLQIQEMGLWL